MADNYTMPAYLGGSERLLGFLLEAVQQGNGWLAQQRPSLEWTRVLEMLGPNAVSDSVVGLSNTGYNIVERNARDIVASLSNFKQTGIYKPTFDKNLYGQAHALTLVDRNWERDTANNVHDTFRANLQNAVSFGTGYLVLDYDKHAHGHYGDIRMRAFGPNDVTFIELPRNHDIQKSYMAIIREELPINLARRVYWNIADSLTPDRESAGWIQRGMQKLQALMGGSPALRVAGTGARDSYGSFATCDIFHAYTWDASINETGETLELGTKDTNWTYRVPSLGSPIPMGITNPATGAEFTRPAEHDDCRLFPLRRYTIFSRNAIAYDGSSPWWHGAVPIARTRFNDWAWEALGKSLLGDVKTMQDGIIAMMRLIEDSAAARLDPPMIYDEQLTSEGFAKKFMPRMAGVRVGGNLQSGAPLVQFPVPAEFYDVPPWITNHIKDQEQRINHQMGTPDLVAIAKAKQVPGEGTLEKLLEMAGPLVDDMVSAQDVPYYELGEWRKALYFQFYTRQRVMEITGPEELDALGIEYDPDTTQFPFDLEFKHDMIVKRIDGESPEARTNRSRGQINEFRFDLQQSSRNERFRMQNRLSLLQLKKTGVPIDRWTFYEAFQIPNPGPAPAGTHNVMERVRAEQLMDLEHAQEIAEMQAQAAGAAAGGVPGGPPAPRGRPSTDAKPPRLITKDGGQRTTIATS